MKKLSIYTTQGIGSIEERIKAIKNAGFDEVCLDFDIYNEPPEVTWEYQVGLADKYGLPVRDVHFPARGMSAIWGDSNEGEYVTERLIEDMKHLKVLGLNRGVCHVTYGLDRPEEPSEIGLDRFLKITEAAEKYGVYVALENSAFSDYLIYLFDNIKSKYIGFCYDSGHENTFCKNVDFLSLFGDRLLCMHLHDNFGAGDDHLIPFKGEINWEKKVALLQKTKLWQKAVTLESTVLAVGNLEEGLSLAYEAAKKLSEM